MMTRLLLLLVLVAALVVCQEEQEEDSGGVLGIAEMAAALLEEEEKGRDDGDDDPTPTCATGWTISGSLCYKLQTRTEDYREAKSACSLYGSGASLASPTSQQIQDVLAELAPADPAQYWLGLDDRTTEGTFTFSDGTTFAKTGGEFGGPEVTWTSGQFTAWRAGQPEASAATREEEDCVAADQDGEWDDVACGRKMAYVCQIAAGATPADTIRGPVDSSKILDIDESCEGEEDGTKCTKRCEHRTCWLEARCWQGHCKRGGHHPCSLGDNHSCCCGNCYLPKTHPENANCFRGFFKQVHKNKNKNKNKNKKKNKNQLKNKLKKKAHKKGKESLQGLKEGKDTPSIIWKKSMEDIFRRLWSKKF